MLLRLTQPYRMGETGEIITYCKVKGNTPTLNIKGVCHKVELEYVVRLVLTGIVQIP